MNSRPFSVLLIDDDEESYLFTRLLFKRMGGRFELHWADSAEKGRGAIDADCHDLYLIDYLLSDGTGLELIRHARKQGCKAPMIMLTMMDGGKTDLEAIDAGASDYLVKGEIDARLLERSMRYAIERNRMNEALLESKRRLASVLANVPVILYSLDSQGIVTFAEGAGLDVLGLRAEQVIGRELRSFYAEHPQVLASIDRALRGEEFTEVLEFRGFVFEVRMRPSFDREGRFQASFGMATDITSWKRAEESLRKSEERYQLASRATIDAIWDWDMTTSHVTWNPNVHMLFRYAPDEVGDTIEWWKESVHPADKERVVEKLRNVIKQKGQFWRDEYRFRCGDGTYAYVLDRGYLVLGQNGEPVRMIGAMTDLTRRKEAEDALREAHDKLEMRVAERTSEIVDMMARLEGAHQMQQRFVADASHDLRTPLTVMRAEVDFLLHRRYDEETRASLMRIDTESRRLENLAGDLLLLAIIDNNQATTLADTVHLDGLLFDCVAQLTTLAREKEIVWNLSVDEPVELHCNASMLSRAVINVLENAIKYSDHGSSVDIRLQVDGDDVMLAIADNGIGIPGDDLARVFDRFYRGDLTRNTAGTGLGLAIVKAVVDAHGGSATINSQPGKGTCVELSFPLSLRETVT